MVKLPSESKYLLYSNYANDLPKQWTLSRSQCWLRERRTNHQCSRERNMDCRTRLNFYILSKDTMASTSKIQEIWTQREYDYKEKHYRATILTMENWDKWECSQTKADAFILWQELVYNLKPNGEYTPKMYLETPKQFWNKGNLPKEDQKVTIASISAWYTKDLIVAWKIELADFAYTADIIFNWVNKHADNVPIQTPQAKPTTPVAQTSASDLITTEQIKLARTLWAKTGLNDEEWKKYVSETYKVSSSKDLTKKQASEFIDYIKTIEPMPLPTKPVDDDLPF